MHARIRLAVLAIAVGWSVGAGVANADVPSLTFVHGGRVWSLNADGSGRAPLPLPSTDGSHAVRYYSAAWSPDGQWLAVMRGVPQDPHPRIDLVRADGSLEQPLTRAMKGGQGFPAWSPDGRRIAFLSVSARRTEIVIAGADGHTRRVVLRQPIVAGRGSHRTLVALSSVAWSPDGRWLAYTREHLDRHAFIRPDIYVVRPDGSHRHLLLRDGQSPAWSPDGSRIAFSSVRDRNGTHRVGEDEDGYDGEIYVMRADGTQLTRLTRSVGDDDTPSWSPDGTRLAFASDLNFPGAFGGDNSELYSIAPDGSCLTWLTNGSPASFGPSWRPGAGVAASTCGGTPSPSVEVDTSAASAVRGYTAFWLGPSVGNLLISAVNADAHGADFEYDDCSTFNPSDCGALPFQIFTEPVCAAERNGSLEDLLVQARRFDVVRGALLVTYFADGGLDVMSGTSLVHLRLDVMPAHGSDAALLRPFVAALRRYGDAAPAQLPAPVLPQRFADRLRRVTSAYSRLHTVRDVARRLHLSRGRVRGRLRIAKALEPFGPLQTAACPRT